MEKKPAKGNIQWVDDELVGFKCDCGAQAITVGTYEDQEYFCACGKRYILEQVNTVYEKEN